VSDRDRVIVYQFDWTMESQLAAWNLCDSLRSRGLDAWTRAPSGGGGITVTLPESELPALFALRRADPERFGQC
jgi:hypothetical protein